MAISMRNVLMGNERWIEPGSSVNIVTPETLQRPQIPAHTRVRVLQSIER